MNRAMRRHYDKCKQKIMTKNIKPKINSVLNKYSGPCAYINGKPIYMGACVFLKPDNQIEGLYDWNLNKLIYKNHRFVILNHIDISKGVLVVGLLSTSSYLNQEKELGIKLNDHYNTDKHIYMDARNLYIIHINCIQSVDYNLTEEDFARCQLVCKNSKLATTVVHKGLIDNYLVDKYYEYFKEKHTSKFNETQQMILDCSQISNYVNKLTIAEIHQYVSDIINEGGEAKENLDMCIDSLKSEFSQIDEQNHEKFFRRLLILYLTFSDNLNQTHVSESLQKGY